MKNKSSVRKILKHGEIRLLICGDRHWDDKHQIKAKLGRLQKECFKSKVSLTVITGGAHGADQQADQSAEELGIDRIIFPANWKGRRKAAGPIRNSKMLKEGQPNWLWAFHKDLSKSKGTKDMVSKAKGKIQCEVFKK